MVGSGWGFYKKDFRRMLAKAMDMNIVLTRKQA